MTAGFVAMDVAWAVGLVALALVAGAAAWGVATVVPGPLGWGLALLAGLAAWIVAATLVNALLPRAKPGRHPLPADPNVALWGLGLVARRWLDLPPMGLLWRQSNVLRFVVLRLCGARVHFTTSMSSDAVVLDPSLLVAGPRVVIGSEAVIAGHYVAGGALVLAVVELGEGTEIATQVAIGPGTRIGRNVRIGPRANIGNDCEIGDGARIGFLATLHPRAKVPAGAVIPPLGVVTADA